MSEERPERGTPPVSAPHSLAATPLRIILPHLTQQILHVPSQTLPRPG